MGCTRNGNWGDPFGVAVLVNPLVRSSKILILKQIKKEKRLLTRGYTRNGTWGELLGGAVLVNPFVRRIK